MPASLAASNVASSPSICGVPRSQHVELPLKEQETTYRSKPSSASPYRDDGNISLVHHLIFRQPEKPMKLLDGSLASFLDERGLLVAQVVRTSEGGRPLDLWVDPRVRQLCSKEVVDVHDI